MTLPYSELAQALHRRARRAMLAGVASLNTFAPGKSKRLPAKLRAEDVHEALSLAVLRFVVLALGAARGLFAREQQLACGRLFAPLDVRLDIRVRLEGGALVSTFPPAFADARATFHSELELGTRQ